MTSASRHVALLMWGTLVLAAGCRAGADTAQVEAVNELITDTDAALLTLNELDLGRYQRADSVFRLEQHRFAMIFEDTLERDDATILGQQYLTLRSAAAMGRDHQRMTKALDITAVRLRKLREDLTAGLIEKGQAATAIATERTLLRELMVNVQQCIDNYRRMQTAASTQDAVDSLLAILETKATP